MEASLSASTGPRLGEMLTRASESQTSTSSRKAVISRGLIASATAAFFQWIKLTLVHYSLKIAPETSSDASALLWRSRFYPDRSQETPKQDSCFCFQRVIVPPCPRSEDQTTQTFSRCPPKGEAGQPAPKSASRPNNTKAHKSLHNPSPRERLHHDIHAARSRLMCW